MVFIAVVGLGVAAPRFAIFAGPEDVGHVAHRGVVGAAGETIDARRGHDLEMAEGGRGFGGAVFDFLGSASGGGLCVARVKRGGGLEGAGGGIDRIGGFRSVGVS